MSDFHRESDKPLAYNGFSKISGGKIPQDIHIAGMAEITGDVECGGIQISGTLHARGNVISHGNLSNAGIMSIDGSMKALGSFESTGTSTIQGFLECSSSFKTSGLLKCRSGMELHGPAEFNGASRIQNTIRSTANLEFNGVSTLRGDVIAQNLKVWPFDLGLDINPFKKWTQSAIHGNIYVKETVKMQRVRVFGDLFAKTITIGKNSNIEGTVYYVNSVEIDPEVTLKSTPHQISEADFEEKVQKYFSRSMEDVSERKRPQFCPGCGEPLEDPAKFCPFCGINLQEMD